jgi:hypothetical protein
MISWSSSYFTILFAKLLFKFFSIGSEFTKIDGKNDKLFVQFQKIHNKSGTI